jgi:hypothetical protein
MKKLLFNFLYMITAFFYFFDFFWESIILFFIYYGELIGYIDGIC